MPFEDPGDARQDAITFTQSRNRRNGEVFPRNQSQSQRRQQAKNLRDKNDALSTVAIRQMAGRQRECHDRHGNNQAHQPKRGGRMSARINLPFHSHGQHQAAGD